tara:strand:- start:5514 stop:5738 length:225 start_codon:yes stop_codon:yes gene_type:complete
LNIFLDFCEKILYIVSMIKIEKNSNFPKFFNVFAFGKFVDQVQGQARAVRVAKKLAKENEQDLIINQGKVEEIA